MRIIKNYFFNLSTKVPFSDQPDIIHRFLDENNLSSNRFLYFFEDIVTCATTIGTPPPECGCARLLKDCPSLGPARFYSGKAHGRFDTVYLSNIDLGIENKISEGVISPLIKKIHRRYRIGENILYYYDIDFFGVKTHFERDFSVAERVCKECKTDFDPATRLGSQPYGSGITIHRDVCGDNYLLMSIDILHDGKIFDAAAYCESMQRLLGGIKPKIFINVYLNNEEKAQIESLNKEALPALEECRRFFSSRLPYADMQNLHPSKYSVAKPLSALAKKHGYTYRILWQGGVFSLEKRTERKNAVLIEVDCGPSRYNLSLRAYFQGVGFNHLLCNSNHTPRNQRETDEYLAGVMRTFEEFEGTLLPKLDAIYPEAPDWFIPSI